MRAWDVDDILAARGFHRGAVRRWRGRLIFDRHLDGIVWRVTLEPRRFLSGSLHGGVIAPIVFELMNEWLTPIEHSLGFPCVEISRLQIQEGRIVALAASERQGRSNANVLSPEFLDRFVIPYLMKRSTIAALLSLSRAVRFHGQGPDWESMKRACLQVGLGDTAAALVTLDEARSRAAHWEYERLESRIASCAPPHTS